MAAASLPEPPAALRAHSERVRQRLCAEIQEHGPIGFDRFMELTLYTPGLGYYSAGLHKLGAAGDFVTAPELSPLFSRCLARQCTQLIQAIPEATLLEVGAGTGAMARDLLAELRATGAGPTRYLILERSADLQQRQHETLSEAGLADAVEWIEKPPASAFSGMVLGNEILDALPVKRFRVSSGQIQELRVGLSDKAFAWVPAPAGAELIRSLRGLDLAGLPDGYASEINLQQRDWLFAIAEHLERGVMLLVDYGYPRSEYYHPQRDTGTLVCHYRHRAHPDPFRYPGLQDITAFVDFTAIAEAADSCDLEVAGFINQGGFLVNCGLTELLSDMESLPDRERLAIAAQVKRLTLPQEMGETFKVIALTRGFDAELIGFARDDQRHRL